MTDKTKIRQALLERHPESFAEQLGIDVTQNTPSPLFRLLCFAILSSARISHERAMEAAKALGDAGWRTAEKLADADWEARVKVLNENGYARFDESYSTHLGDAAQHLVDAWGGDLRQLREDADRDPDDMRERLKEHKGLGDTGVDIFFRDVQLAWEELHPFADDKALAAAKGLGLGGSAQALADQCNSREEYVRLIDALLLASLDDEIKDLKAT